MSSPPSSSTTYSKSAIKLSGFQVFPVVRTKRYGSGLAIAIKYDICTAVMIDEGKMLNLLQLN